MTYEQKAKELVEALYGDKQIFVKMAHSREGAASRWDYYARAQSLITTALREAGNAKLEEAARGLNQRLHIVLSPPLSNAAVSADYLEGLQDAEAEIRSLIQKD